MSKFICRSCMGGNHPHEDQFYCSNMWTDSLCQCKTLTSSIAPRAIDAAHLQRQIDFSGRTFGPPSQQRFLGVIDHIKKELKEIKKDPTDIMEWIDVVILAFDGAWRAGWKPQEIIDALIEKQEINENREWPDWRTAKEGKAIEHVR